MKLRNALVWRKSISETYIAACGLDTPHLDHSRRAVDFAREMRTIAKRFNAKHNLNLALAVGISTGPVIAGIVGRNKFIYDVWGETVLQADRAHETASPGEIIVTEPVRDMVKDLYSFNRVESKDMPVPIWSLSNETPGSA